MELQKLNYFKNKLLKEKMKILNGQKTTPLHVSSDDLSEEGDLANSVIGQNIIFGINKLESDKLHLIEEALERIEDGTFGLCQDCDEEIDMKRLESTPWADLCLIHAEEREREAKRKVA